MEVQAWDDCAARRQATQVLKRSAATVDSCSTTELAPGSQKECKTFAAKKAIKWRMAEIKRGAAVATVSLTQCPWLRDHGSKASVLRSSHENVGSWQQQEVMASCTQANTVVDKRLIRNIAECATLCQRMDGNWFDGEKWRGT